MHSEPPLADSYSYSDYSYSYSYSDYSYSDKSCGLGSNLCWRSSSGCAHACILHWTHAPPDPMRGIAAAQRQAPGSLDVQHRKHPRRSQKIPQRSLSSPATFLLAGQNRAPQASRRHHRPRLARSSRRHERHPVRFHRTRGTTRLVAARTKGARRSTPTGRTPILTTTRTKVAREQVRKSRSSEFKCF